MSKSLDDRYGSWSCQNALVVPDGSRFGEVGQQRWIGPLVIVLLIPPMADMQTDLLWLRLRGHEEKTHDEQIWPAVHLRADIVVTILGARTTRATVIAGGTGAIARAGAKPGSSRGSRHADVCAQARPRRRRSRGRDRACRTRRLAAARSRGRCRSSGRVPPAPP
jgi:hypothetical protein